MALKVITPPAALPVTVAEAKAHLNVEHAADDTLILAYIETAVQLAQHLTDRQLVEAEYELVLDGFPRDPVLSQLAGRPIGLIEFPKPPLLTVESIKYLDQDGVQQTLASTEYEVDSDGLVGRVYPAYGKCWPVTRAMPNAVRLRFTCGWAMEYDETTSPPASPPVWTGPEAIKTWIKVRVATLYAQRESLVQGQTVAELPRSHVDGLLDPFIVPMVP